MPLHLEPLDVMDELAHSHSVLIVSCPVCPPISVAIQRDAPFLELFKHGIKTGAFEDYIADIRRALAQRGARTDVFTSYLPTPTMCLWTAGQRRRLQQRAAEFDAVMVLGCDSSTYTVRQALDGTGIRVVQAMSMTGVTNARVKFQLPMTIALEDRACVDVGEPGGKSQG